MAKIYYIEKYRLQKRIEQIENQIIHTLEHAPFFDSYGLSILRNELNDLKIQLIQFEEQRCYYEEKQRSY